MSSKRARARLRGLAAAGLVLAFALVAAFWVADQQPVPGGPHTEVVAVAAQA